MKYETGSNDDDTEVNPKKIVLSERERIKHIYVYTSIF